MKDSWEVLSGLPPVRWTIEKVVVALSVRVRFWTMQAMVATKQAKRIVVGFVSLCQKMSPSKRQVNLPQEHVATSGVVHSSTWKPGQSGLQVLDERQCGFSDQGGPDCLRLLRPGNCLPAAHQLEFTRPRARVVTLLSVKSTFVLDSRGIYTCTWCGRTK